MKGRGFGVHNKVYPIAVRRLDHKRPACFMPEQWSEWLTAEWRRVLNLGDEQRAFARGEHPNPCQDCSIAFQARMQDQGRCHPADSGLTPLAQKEAAT